MLLETLTPGSRDISRTRARFGAAVLGKDSPERSVEVMPCMWRIRTIAAFIILVEEIWVKPNERVTVWWQILAFFVLTIAEILISVTGLELAFVAAPPTMKSFVTACWLVTVGMAKLSVLRRTAVTEPLARPTTTIPEAA